MLSINLPCLGYRQDCGSDGYEYDCEYDSCTFCEDCVCCESGGYYNPRTGKRINLILRIIKDYRVKKYYKNKYKELSKIKQ